VSTISPYDFEAIIEDLEDQVKTLEAEVERLKDSATFRNNERLREELKPGTWVGCIHCGDHCHSDGTEEGDDALRAHIRICPDHPLSAALTEIEQMRERNANLRESCEIRGRALESAEKRLALVEKMEGFD